MDTINNKVFTSEEVEQIKEELEFYFEDLETELADAVGTLSNIQLCGHLSDIYWMPRFSYEKSEATHVTLEKAVTDHENNIREFKQHIRELENVIVEHEKFITNFRAEYLNNQPNK